MITATLPGPAWVATAALLCGASCGGGVQLECNVCGEDQVFPTCQELYCRYLAAGSQCAATDLESCYAREECPSPYFLFCPADRRDE